MYDKPWMRPIQYNDDTLDMTAPSAADAVLDADANNEEEGIVKPIPDDPPREASKPCNVSHDTTPMHYRKQGKPVSAHFFREKRTDTNSAAFLTKKG